MSLSGVKYTAEERTKFTPIVEACVENDMVKAKSMIQALTVDEQSKFKGFYTQERENFLRERTQQEQRLKAKLETHQNNVTKLDTEIDHLKQQRSLNFQHGVKSAVATHKQADLSATAKPKAKKSFCAIM